MIYVLLTYLFSPFLYLISLMRRKDEPKRILIIQTSKIGDLICSTPIFRELKKRYPHAYLTVMVNPVTAKLLEYNPYIDRIIPMEMADYKGFLGKLRLSNIIRQGKYDVAITLNPNVPFAVAMLWSIVPVRLSVMPDFSGITFKLASIFFTHLERHIHGRLVIETYMQMLKALGIESNNLSKEVYKSDIADIKIQEILGKINRPLVGIGVSSGNKLKELGEEKIVKLIDLLIEREDVYIVLIGSNKDMHLARMVSDRVKNKCRIIDTTGKLSLGELPALIERLSLFIGVDTGITYMADALSVPLINIAGPSDMTDQRPLGKRSLIIQKNIACVPCSNVFRSPYHCKEGNRDCITSVNISEIVNSAKGLIRKS